jgi:NAD(P)-dependent dehydrogenase (short-subunit alcohol dehydrogenase family)
MAVRDLEKDWNRKLDRLVNNAGVQFSSRDNFTTDSFEETIAVNHLAAFMLTLGLAKHLKGGGSSSSEAGSRTRAIPARGSSGSGELASPR